MKKQVKKKKPKTITKAKLNALIKKTEGDWDFLMYKLSDYWDGL